MIWKTTTHRFTATICQHTGKPCPALARMSRALVEAVAQAGPSTTEDFEIEGNAELTHCPDGCTARFRANPNLVRIYCGSDPQTDTDLLERYADLMFGSGLDSLPANTMTTMPCAMLEALALSPHGSVSAEHRPSA